MVGLGDIAILEQFLSVDFELLNPPSMLLILALEQLLLDGVLEIKIFFAWCFLNSYLLGRVAIFEERMLTHLSPTTIPLL